MNNMNRMSEIRNFPIQEMLIDCKKHLKIQK